MCENYDNIQFVIPIGMKQDLDYEPVMQTIKEEHQAFKSEIVAMGSDQVHDEFRRRLDLYQESVAAVEEALKMVMIEHLCLMELLRKDPSLSLKYPFETLVPNYENVLAKFQKYRIGEEEEKDEDEEMSC